MANATIQRRRLGAELRRLREAAGLTGDQVAEQLECSHSTISRIELGRGGVRPRDVRDLLAVYGVTDPERVEELLALARTRKERGQRTGLTDHLPNAYQTYIDLEDAASEVSAYHPYLVPGLLQTEEYARAVEREALVPLDAERLQVNVATRLARQLRRAERGKPRLWVVLDESVLYRQIGGKGVLGLQLDHLLDASEDEDTVLQVLPLTSGHPRQELFTVLEFEPEDAPVVYLDTITGGSLTERPDEIKLYTRARDLVRASALPPRQSRDRIGQVRKDLTR